MAKENKTNVEKKQFTPKNPLKTWWGKLLLWIIIISFAFIPLISLIWALAKL